MFAPRHKISVAATLVSVSYIFTVLTTQVSTADSVTTTVSDVRGLVESPGGKAMIAYTIRHDVNSHVDPGSPLPGARIASRDYQGVFDGAYGDAAFAGAWLAPQSMMQLSPVSQLYENTYFFDQTQDKDAFGTQQGLPMEAGDYAEVAVENATDDAPLSWDAERSNAIGNLAWDLATDSRNVSASYVGVTGNADVIFLRADIVARGGDVDARAESLSVEPLVIDLPKTYGSDATASYIIATAFPTAQYVKSMRMTVEPQTGKAVLAASVQGYFPAANEDTLPSGAQIKEWHLSLHGVIIVKPTDGLTGNSALTLPAGSHVVAGAGNQVKEFDLPAGGQVVAGTGGMIKLLQNNGGSESEGLKTSVSASQSELAVTSAIDHTSSTPVNVSAGDYSAIVDPDFRGNGTLALRSVNRLLTGTRFAETMAVPFVTISGVPVNLDRNRLVDLRVYPDNRWAAAQFTGYGEANLPSRVQTVFVSAFQPGLTMQAIYDLGDSQYAFVKLQAGHFLAPPSFIPLRTTVVSLNTGSRISAAPVQYFEVPFSGSITYNGEVQPTEFSAPLDILSSNEQLILGQRSFTGTVFSSNTSSDGQVTVVPAPGPLTNLAQPGDGSLDGKSVALYYTHSPGAVNSPSGAAVGLVQLDAESFTPKAQPKSIDQLCGAPLISDGPVADAQPEVDIQAAWFDLDDANLYASIQVANLPAAAPSGTNYSWAMHWRNQHSTYYGRAILDDSGNFSFEFGSYNLNTTLPSYQKSADVTGDYKLGQNGIVRIWIPRLLLGYVDGDLLRDTSARSQVTINGQTVEADQAPDGSNPVFGSGGDYRVQKCGSNATVTLVNSASRKTHGNGATFEIDLTDGNGIESRSGGADGNYELVYRFLNQISSVSGSRVSAGAGSVASSNIDPNDPHNYIVELTGVTNAQRITVTLDDVTDSAGNFSSAISAQMGVLVGDINASGRVDASDISAVRQQTLQTITSSNFRADINTSGRIDAADVSIARQQALTSLP